MVRSPLKCLWSGEEAGTSHCLANIYLVEIGPGYRVFIWAGRLSSLKIRHNMRSVLVLQFSGFWVCLVYISYFIISVSSDMTLIIIIRCYFNTSNAINQLLMSLKQCDRILKKPGLFSLQIVSLLVNSIIKRCPSVT